MPGDIRLCEKYLMAPGFPILKCARVSGGKMQAERAPELGIRDTAIKVHAVRIEIPGCYKIYAARD
jgi:hypothetical protein